VWSKKEDHATQDLEAGGGGGGGRRSRQDPLPVETWAVASLKDVRGENRRRKTYPGKKPDSPPLSRFGGKEG